jgi:hypothetical protein
MEFLFQLETKVNCEGFYWQSREVVQVNDCGTNEKAARDIARDWGREHYPNLLVDAQRVYKPACNHVDVVI